jgi:hypothetical protein
MNIWKGIAIVAALLAPWVVRISDSHEIESLKATIEAISYTSGEDERALQMWRHKYDSVASDYEVLKKWVADGQTLALDSSGKVIMLSWDTHGHPKEVNFNKPVNTVNIGN